MTTITTKAVDMAGFTLSKEKAERLAADFNSEDNQLQVVVEPVTTGQVDPKYALRVLGVTVPHWISFSHSVWNRTYLFQLPIYGNSKRSYFEFRL